jgi:hypothetical protein
MFQTKMLDHNEVHFTSGTNFLGDSQFLKNVMEV